MKQVCPIKCLQKYVVMVGEDGERRIKGNQSSTITTRAFDLNYCPACGRKVKK